MIFTKPYYSVGLETITFSQNYNKFRNNIGNIPVIFFCNTTTERSSLASLPFAVK
jgi:arginine/ornithine N-succinyltransferase beta subunit